MYDKNLYAYCDNNPVMRLDSDDEFWNVAAGAIMGAAISVGVEVLFQAGEYVATGGMTGLDAQSIALAAVSGAVDGALTASGLRRVGQFVGNAVLSGATEYYEQKKTGDVNVVRVGAAAIIGGITSDDRGIRARGTPYRTTINNLKTAKAKHKALNTKRTQKVLYRATKKSNAAKITVTKATAKSYAKGTVKSSFWGIFKSWLGI